MGKLSNESKFKSENSLLIHSLLTNREKISDLWELDSLGIKDPSEKRSKLELQDLALKHFENTILRDDEGRYIVSIPWIEGSGKLEDHYSLAKGRLEKTVKALKFTGRLFDYEQALWWGGFWDHTRRINWNLGKILKLYPSKDEKVRAAQVKTKLGTFLRPVQKLYLLEVMEKNKSSVHPTNSPLFSDANEGSHLPINIDPELSKHQAAATPSTQPCSSVSSDGELRQFTSAEPSIACSSVSNGGGGLKLRAETSGHQQAETSSMQPCSRVSDGEAEVEPRVETLELPDDLTSEVELQQPAPRRSRYGRLLKLRKRLNDSC
ncbi:DUF1758 domain-containing protein [Trichonephila clavata]|uniref:DUF1758 domain-containing protein n=1 Tax=Trichonephila clavata TaxID=2740835 RepID=A0A8X6GAN6_TRICU|nr:DUF1758 domain-containing protein [Trichonephila clavata]